MNIQQQQQLSFARLTLTSQTNLIHEDQTNTLNTASILL